MACTSSARVTLIVPRVHLAEKQFVGSDGAAMAIPIGLEAGKHFPELHLQCGNEDGHFIGLFEFLKDKNVIHPLSPEQIKELRQNVQFVSCSNCGASINLQSNSACPYCHSPISMLDMKQPQRMLEQL